MNEPRATGPLEYKVVQSIRHMGPSSPAAVAAWIQTRDGASHAFDALYTTLVRLVGKGYLSVERCRGSDARGALRDMDVYSTTREGVHAARAFEKSVLNFMLPEGGEQEKA